MPQSSAPAFVALIPARFASSRLPGKPLADIAGRPMVVRVAERALEAGATQVAVATEPFAVVPGGAATAMKSMTAVPLSV